MAFGKCLPYLTVFGQICKVFLSNRRDERIYIMHQVTFCWKGGGGGGGGGFFKNWVPRRGDFDYST